MYCVSVAGVTGARETLPEELGEFLQRVRRQTKLPLAVGFGISRPEHVAQLGRQVEAVVVGSAIVALIERNLDNVSLEIQLESFVRELKHGFEMAQAGANRP